MNTSISLHEACELIWREADLLDRLGYSDWQALWTESGKYVIPVQRDGGDPEECLNILYDDKAMREARIRRLLSGFSTSSAPPARTVRSLSRFVVAENGEDRITVRCAQHLVEYKYERMRHLPADVTYRIVREGGRLKIDLKSVLLINSDFDIFGIGYLL